VNAYLVFRLPIRFLHLLMTSFSLLYPFLLATFASAEIVSYEERSDPDGPSEVVRFDQAEVEKSLAGRGRGVEKNPKEFAKALLKISLDYARDNINRQKNRREIDEFLQILGLRFINPETKKPQPYCAAGVSFAASRAYCDLEPSVIDYSRNKIPQLQGVLPDIARYYFKPSPSVFRIAEAAKIDKDKRWVEPNFDKPEAGWLIVFAFPKNGVPSAVPNHIGIVRDGTNHDIIKTVEYNTTPEKNTGFQANGGAVAERNRSRDYVVGFVNTTSAGH